jgi:23S rRNA (cytidine1920-2'-O)/16S rRNA (cytidine1409-2'-O)-methyltransferase
VHSSVRLDQFLVDRGLAPSRSRARSWILGGKVTVNGAVVEKPGHSVRPDAEVKVSPGPTFASRGGDKLNGALETLGVDVRGLVCLDIGASTGGFTDCLLQRGARKIYAVDVGHGQLAARLREDARVVVRERTNARHLDATAFDEPIDVVVVDASFISLEMLLPAIQRVLPVHGRVVALVKPQFEVGREAARQTRGVVRDPALRARTIEGTRTATEIAGFRILGEATSSVAGPKGNVEHFLYAERFDPRAP